MYNTPILYIESGDFMSSFVYLKNKKNQVTYVYENESKWDSATKKCLCKRVCIGHLDPATDKVVPNQPRTKKVDIPGEKASVSVLSFGVMLLFQHIIDDLDLEPILKKCFPSDWKQILSCSYFLLSEGKPLSYIERWSSFHKSPCGNILTGQQISDLLLRTTQSKQLDFFRQWVKKCSETEYFALDITSVSSYSQQNEFVRYGYNRDGEPLPQINICMLLGESSHLPIYYQVLPGSIHDVSTLQNILLTLSLLNTGSIHVVMDKGFCSEANIDDLYRSHLHFTVGMSFVGNFAKDCVIKAKEQDIMNYANFHQVRDKDIFASSWLHNWKGHRMYVHVYYDSEKADGQYRAFLRELSICKEELENKKENKKHLAMYKRYFTVKETPKRGRKVQVNQEEVETYHNTTAGYFVLSSNSIKDPVDALTVYREKDAVEKGFDNLKNSIDCKRLRVHSEEAMQGRLFIQYIALIIASQIQRIMKEHDLYKRLTMPDLINEMKSIQEIHISGKREPVYTTLTKQQREIMNSFGIDPSTYV